MIIEVSKIKAVIFDWGGVCCAEGEPFASLDLQQTLQMSPNQIADKAREIYNGYYLGQYNRESFWGAILKHFNLREDNKLNPSILSFAYLSSYSIYPDVLDRALELRSKYQVGLLSNLTPEMRDNIREKHNLENFFDIQVYSCDSAVQAIKPDKKPYEVILEKIGLKAQECLFIDNSKKNIEAAENLGFQTILFLNPKQVLKELSIL